MTHLEHLDIFLAYFAQHAEDHPLTASLSGAEIETLKIFARWLDAIDKAQPLTATANCGKMDATRTKTRQHKKSLSQGQ